MSDEYYRKCEHYESELLNGLTTSWVTYGSAH
jgi:hypothetical protein